MGKNTLKNQRWRKDIRRHAAQARQEVYDQLSLEDKLAKAGAKERAKLLKKAQNDA